MRNIIIEHKDLGKGKVEMVERKGTGHPDTICDSICEEASLALSRYYLKRFGKVLHHNVDKGLLVAGKSAPKFGGGKIIKPWKVIIAGRATGMVGKRKVPVNAICQKAATEHLSGYLSLKPSTYMVMCEIMEGAGNLKEIFRQKAAKANDTSFGCAHWPLSETEDLVIGVADYINSQEFRRRFPAAGSDIKVMGHRIDDQEALTIAVAMIDKHVSSMAEYVEIKNKMLDDLEKKALDVNIDINTLDDIEGDENSVYLTVTGLSAEMGDDGQVGRGNRPNGLITPNWPMSLEATSGKNINHPGKLYQVMAQICAEEACKVAGVEKAAVELLSQIGGRLDEPQAASVQVGGKDIALKNVAKAVDSVFERLPEIQKGIVKGKYRMF